MAEREAADRSCHNTWLNTFEFQARGFYEKLGYRCFGELPVNPRLLVTGMERADRKQLRPLWGIRSRPPMAGSG